MQAYWITFEDGTTGCCEGFSGADAKAIAKHITGKAVEKAEILPYPGGPIIWQFEHPIHGKVPNFCGSPKTCAGHSACPKSYACSE